MSPLSFLSCLAYQLLRPCLTRNSRTCFCLSRSLSQIPLFRPRTTRASATTYVLTTIHTHAIVWIILTSTRTDPLMSNGQQSTTMSPIMPQISVASDSSSTLTPLRMLRSASKVKHLSPSTSHASNPSLSTAALPGTTSQP